VAELVYPPVIAVARVAWAAMGLRLRATGAEHVPRHGGAVMAINHTGWLDFTFAGLAARPAHRLVRFMAKDGVFRHPVSGPLMRGMKHIPVDRDAGTASFNAAVEALRAGEIVGVFPEATMSPSFELLPFKQGAVRMAQEAGVPLLPTIVWGSQRVATYNRRKPLTQRRVTVTVTVGEPLELAPDEGIAAGTRRLRATMTEMLHAAQAAYPDHPSGPDDTWWVPSRLGGKAVTPEEGLAMVNARRRAAGGDVDPSRDSGTPASTT
jgi:1-acyl-sn-glycerol-3-phosphate acyltransferase